MTEDNTTEAVTPEGESTPEESAVIKQLRQQLKDTQRELKAAPVRSEVEAEIRARYARERAIEGELVALKLPAGLSETVDGKLGDAEVTPEGVLEALKAIGFEVTDSAEGGAPESPVAQDLSKVANLGTQIAAAATQQDTDNLTDKINAAETPAELAQIMREAGQSQ